MNEKEQKTELDALLDLNVKMMEALVASQADHVETLKELRIEQAEHLDTMRKLSKAKEQTWKALKTARNMLEKMKKLSAENEKNRKRYCDAVQEIAELKRECGRLEREARRGLPDSLEEDGEG